MTSSRDQSDRSEAKKKEGRPRKFVKYFLLFVGAFLLLVMLLGVAVFFFLGSKSIEITNTNSDYPTNRLEEFPWPPRASAYTKIPPQYLLRPQGQTSLKDVAAKLESAFRSGGYLQTGYYSVPGGFALVSQLEQFQPSGVPVADPYRWSQQVKPRSVFSLDYLSYLIRGKVGRYRVIVFAVSDDFFSQKSGKRVDIEEASRIALEGANILPPEVGNLPYTDNYTCTALVYEFEKRVLDKPAEFKETGTLFAETHLQKILPYLQR